VAVMLAPGQTDRALSVVAPNTDTTVLTSTEDLDRMSRDGLLGAFDRFAAAMGDEGLVLDEFRTGLEEGQHVVIVPIGTGDEARDLVSRLRDVTSGPLWHFGAWTFIKIEGEAQ
jgi:hypothetical protein